MVYDLPNHCFTGGGAYVDSVSNPPDANLQTSRSVGGGVSHECKSNERFHAFSRRNRNYKYSAANKHDVHFFVRAKSRRRCSFISNEQTKFSFKLSNTNNRERWDAGKFPKHIIYNESDPDYGFKAIIFERHPYQYFDSNCGCVQLNLRNEVIA